MINQTTKTKNKEDKLLFLFNNQKDEIMLVTKNKNCIHLYYFFYF